jgi:cobalt-zinc-cadmium efflux system membrane fusion protein
MKKSYIYIALIMALAGCKSNDKAVKPDIQIQKSNQTNIITLDKDQLALAKLETSILEKGEARMDLHLNGKVDVPPTAVASVSIPLGGYIQDINLIPGNFVKKGSVLATVKDPLYIQLQEDYLTAKSKSVYLTQDMERQKMLLQQDAVSKKNFQLLQSEFNTNAIQLKGLGEKLKLVNIDPATLTVDKMTTVVKLISPISGYVSKVNINRGKYVAPTDILLELIDPNDVHAAITVFEKDIILFKEGMKGKVTLSNEPNSSYMVSVLAVSRNLDDDKSGLLHCHFSLVPKNILPGMFLTANFSVSTKEAIIVPISAIQRFQGIDYIFIQNSANEFEAKKVQVASINKETAALSNPEAKDWLGKKIVTVNSYSLLGKLMNKTE